MRRQTSNNPYVEKFLGLEESLETAIPQVFHWWNDRESFGELRLKARGDGVVLAIAKGYGADGGPLVCFGTGLSVGGALLGLEGSLAANKWKVDEPWDPPSK